MPTPDEMIEFVWADEKAASRVLKELARLAERYRVELLEQWEEIHGN